MNWGLCAWNFWYSCVETWIFSGIGLISKYSQTSMGFIICISVKFSGQEWEVKKATFFCNSFCLTLNAWTTLSNSKSLCNPYKDPGKVIAKTLFRHFPHAFHSVRKWEWIRHVCFLLHGLLLLWFEVTLLTFHSFFPSTADAIFCYDNLFFSPWTSRTICCMCIQWNTQVCA